MERLSLLLLSETELDVAVPLSSFNTLDVRPRVSISHYRPFFSFPFCGCFPFHVAHVRLSSTFTDCIGTRNNVVRFVGLLLRYYASMYVTISPSGSLHPGCYNRSGLVWTCLLLGLPYPLRKLSKYSNLRGRKKRE